jgi:uncharacterized membrane protein
MEACGYVAVRNHDAKDGKWVVEGKRRVIYAKSSLTAKEQQAAARERAERANPEDGGGGPRRSTASGRSGRFRYGGI